jgi:hypothetical protein
VDLGAISDATTRRAIEAQISNFGQTPPQLFKRRHPPRCTTWTPPLPLTLRLAWPGLATGLTEHLPAAQVPVHHS